MRKPQKENRYALPRTDVDLIIEHAHQLITAKGFTQRPAKGPEMEELGILHDGAVAIHNGRIVAVSKTDEILSMCQARERIDATGKIVTPGFIDAAHSLRFRRLSRI